MLRGKKLGLLKNISNFGSSRLKSTVIQKEANLEILFRNQILLLII